MSVGGKIGHTHKSVYKMSSRLKMDIRSGFVFMYMRFTDRRLSCCCCLVADVVAVYTVREANGAR